MLGINYESSDEEEVAPISPAKEAIVGGTQSLREASQKNGESSIEKGPIKSAQASLVSNPESSEQIHNVSGPINGPAQGPIASPPPSVPGPQDEGDPGSPHSSNQSLIRSLTLPTDPNFQIPASPPGSPPQRSTKKFAQFLELKKKGQHFNQRLESSSVLRDPAHLQKLMDFAGISNEDQYASTLPEDLAIPNTFPDWAYFEELSASQKKITKAKEESNARVPRDGIDFVPATNSGASSHSGTPSAKGIRQSAAERVMAGLDRPQPGKRKELEQRGGRNTSASSSVKRTGSRSPKRRRSRSRERR